MAFPMYTTGWDIQAGSASSRSKLGLALETVWCWQALALRGLAQESAAVQRELERGDLPAARKVPGVSAVLPGEVSRPHPAQRRQTGGGQVGQVVQLGRRTAKV